MWYNNSSSGLPMDPSPQNIAKQLLFGLIAALAIFGNLLFGFVLIRKRSKLSRAYNKLLLSLAITDLLTGILIIVTPNFILAKDWLHPPDDQAGELFCRVIYNRMLIFLFGKASILTAAFLAVERWFSVLRPIQYRVTFSSGRIAACIIFTWLASFAMQASKLVTIYATNGTCKGKPDSSESQGVTIFYVWVTFFLPSSIIWGTFAHIWVILRKSQRELGYNRRAVARRLLGVCAIAAIIMTLCWVPVQISYILSRFGILTVGSSIHQANQMLAMSNSCINPWIFCLANKEYRQDILALVSWMCCVPCCRGSVRRTSLSMKEIIPKTNAVELVGFIRVPDHSKCLVNLGFYADFPSNSQQTNVHVAQQTYSQEVGQYAPNNS